MAGSNGLERTSSRSSGKALQPRRISMQRGNSYGGGDSARPTSSSSSLSRTSSLRSGEERPSSAGSIPSLIRSKLSSVVQKVQRGRYLSAPGRALSLTPLSSFDQEDVKPTRVRSATHLSLPLDRSSTYSLSPQPVSPFGVLATDLNDLSLSSHSYFPHSNQPNPDPCHSYHPDQFQVNNGHYPSYSVAPPGPSSFASTSYNPHHFQSYDPSRPDLYPHQLQRQGNNSSTSSQGSSSLYTPSSYLSSGLEGFFPLSDAERHRQQDAPMSMYGSGDGSGSVFRWDKSSGY